VRSRLDLEEVTAPTQLAPVPMPLCRVALPSANVNVGPKVNESGEGVRSLQGRFRKQTCCSAGISCVVCRRIVCKQNEAGKRKTAECGYRCRRIYRRIVIELSQMG